MSISPEADPRVHCSQNIVGDVDIVGLKLPSEREPVPEETPELLDYFRRIQEWQDAVSSVKAGIDAMRKSRKESLRQAIADGIVSTGAEIAAARRRIKADVARGLPGITGSHSSDNPESGRRRYFVTVSKIGNVIGSFEREDLQTGALDRPRPTDKQILHVNPTLAPPHFK